MERYDIKHSLDPVLNKSLIEDVLEVMKLKGLTGSKLSRALKSYLKDDVQPYTPLELYKACMLFLKDPSIEETTILSYATNRRIEKDKQEEQRKLKEYSNSLKQYKKSIERTIEAINLELKVLKHKQGIKAIAYDSQRLENARDLQDHKLTSYLNKKMELEQEIEAYKDLLTKIDKPIK